jgi:hypothetical protein
MVKKRVKEKKSDFFKDIVFNLKWGFKGIQVSFFLLIILVVLFLIIAFMIFGDISDLNSIVFKIPQGPDYWGIFAGTLLFIVVPFLIGIKVGMTIKKK